MSELEGSLAMDQFAMAAHGSNVAGEQEPSAGTLLKSAREAAGLHIAALAVSLKVPAKKLEALEADRLDLLPDAVFVRALASSVCRSLKMDATEVLSRLPQSSAPKLNYQGKGINTPFRAPSDGPGPSVWTQISRSAVLGGLLLLGALVLIFFPAVQPGSGEGKSVAETSALATAPARPLATAVAAGAEAPDNAKPAVSAGPTEAPAMASTTVASPPVPVLAAGLTSAPTVPVAAPAPPFAATAASPAPVLAGSGPAATASAAAQPAPTGIVVFRAKGASWVEVSDAKGQVVLRRTLSAGEVAGASGALPLAAVVGRADATSVHIRGQVFDLKPLARDNVARFEVK